MKSYLDLPTGPTRRMITKLVQSLIQPPGGRTDLIPGADFSHHNGELNWELIKEQILFAIIKATEGLDFTDPNFLKNIAGARDAGLPVGAYHFVIPSDDAVAQAKFFANTIKPLQSGDLIWTLDVEKRKKKPNEWFQVFGPRNSKQAAVKRTDYVLKIMDAIAQEVGSMGMLYMSSSFSRDMFMEDERLLKAKLFVAHYTKNPNPFVPLPWTVFTLWQSMQNGRLNGALGDVDFDWFLGTIAELNKLRMP